MWIVHWANNHPCIKCKHILYVVFLSFFPLQIRCSVCRLFAFIIKWIALERENEKREETKNYDIILLFNNFYRVQPIHSSINYRSVFERVFRKILLLIHLLCYDAEMYIHHYKQWNALSWSSPYTINRYGWRNSKLFTLFL